MDIKLLEFEFCKHFIKTVCPWANVYQFLHPLANGNNGTFSKGCKEH